MLKKLKDNLFFIVVINIYIAITFFVIIRTHEIWADEAQAWLIARDLSITGIIKQMANEGHSCMWHLILMPFAKLGFSCEIMKYISWSFCIVTVAIILKKAPFNKFLKVLLVFSTGFMYFYSAHSRCYSMIPLFLALIAVIYKNRHEKPYKYNILLFLLANTHAVMLPTAFLLLVFYVIEGLKNKKYKKREVICSSLIGILGIIIFLLQALQMYFSPNFIKDSIDIKRIFDDCSLIISQIEYQLVGNAPISQLHLIIIYIIIMMCVMATFGNRKQAVIFWSQLLFCIILEALKWFSNVYRAILIIYTIMFWLWNYREDGLNIENKKIYESKLGIALVIILLLTIPQYIQIIIDDYNGNYSASKDTAKYIKSNINDGAVFLGTYSYMLNSVIAYFNKNEYLFYSLDDEEYFTYIPRYNNWLLSISSDRIEEIIIELIYNGKKDIYFIEMNISEVSYAADNFEIMYKSKCIKNVNAAYEEYVIYKIDIDKYI